MFASLFMLYDYIIKLQTSGEVYIFSFIKKNVGVDPKEWWNDPKEWRMWYRSEKRLRNRKSENIRSMVRETSLSLSNLIQPLFLIIFGIILKLIFVVRFIKIVKSKKIIVKGKATDKDGIYEVLVNGVDAQVFEDGSFSPDADDKIL